MTELIFVRGDNATKIELGFVTELRALQVYWLNFAKSLVYYCIICSNLDPLTGPGCV